MSSYYEKLLATGEVKCIDEEINTAIPEGWSFARFGTVVYNRDSERIPLSVSERSRLKKTYDYYGASGVIDKVDKYLFDKDLLLIGEDGANLINRSTPIAFIATGKYWVNNHAHVLDCIDNVFMRYICLYINSISLVEYVTGTAQPKMNQEKMNSIMVLVPPYKEQIRILKKVEEVLPTIMRYGACQCRLNVLNKELYTNLRKSLLQEAIQGKLVPQDPSDEPASILLQRIKEEKLRLIKEGKLKKKDVVDSIIYKGDDNKYCEKIGESVQCIDEEIPFEIPESWVWVRLENCISLLSGRDLEPSQYNDNKRGFPYITGASNFKKGTLYVNRWTNSPITIATKGSLLLTCKGTIGAMAFNNIGAIHIARQVMAIEAYLINLQYIRYYLQFNINALEKNANSMIPGISRNTILKMLFPLPPLAEQKRIVEKVYQLTQLLK